MFNLDIFKTKKGKQFLILFLVLSLLIIIISIPFILHNLEEEEHHIHGPRQEAYEDTIIFKNREPITNLFGKTVSNPLADCIEKFTLSPKEKDSAPHKNTTPDLAENFYNLYFDEKNITRLSSNQNLSLTDFFNTYKIYFSLSDGRKYEIIIKIISEGNNPDYAFSIIKNTENNSISLCKINTSDSNSAKNWIKNELKLDQSQIKEL